MHGDCLSKQETSVHYESQEGQKQEKKKSKQSPGHIPYAGYLLLTKYPTLG